MDQPWLAAGLGALSAAVHHGTFWRRSRLIWEQVMVECKSRKSRNTWVTGKFGLGMLNEAGQRLIEFCQENALVIANTLFQQQREDSTHEHHQMVNTEIRLIIFFAAQDGEALYSQQKQDRELTGHRSCTPYCQIQT